MYRATLPPTSASRTHRRLTTTARCGRATPGRASRVGFRGAAIFSPAYWMIRLFLGSSRGRTRPSRAVWSGGVQCGDTTESSSVLRYTGRGAPGARRAHQERFHVAHARRTHPIGLALPGGRRIHGRAPVGRSVGAAGRARPAPARPSRPSRRTATWSSRRACCRRPPASPATSPPRPPQVLDELSRRLAGARYRPRRASRRPPSTSHDAEDFAAHERRVGEVLAPSIRRPATTVVVPLPRRGARIQVSAGRRAPAMPAGRWSCRRAGSEPSSPVQLRHPGRRHAVPLGTRLAAGHRQRPRAGRHHGPDAHRIRERPGDSRQKPGSRWQTSPAPASSSRTWHDFEAHERRLPHVLPDAPPARATVKTGLTGSDFLVEITFLAAKGVTRTAVTTPAADGTPGKPNPNLSSAIAVGPRLFLSGMLGMLPGARPDAAAQTTETLARLGRTLTAGGFAWPHVCRLDRLRHRRVAPPARRCGRCRRRPAAGCRPARWSAVNW